MADRIDDLVGQEAYDQVIKLDKMMSELVTRFDLVAKSALSMQVALGDTKKIIYLFMDLHGASTMEFSIRKHTEHLLPKHGMRCAKRQFIKMANWVMYKAQAKNQKMVSLLATIKLPTLKIMVSAVSSLQVQRSIK